MTGRELIIYILNNHLENEDIFKDGVLVGFESELEVAARLGFGVATVRTMYKLGILPGFTLGEHVFIIKGAMPEERGGVHEKTI